MKWGVLTSHCIYCFASREEAETFQTYWRNELEVTYPIMRLCDGITKEWL